MSRGCARAWSSSANLGPGFDSLAIAHRAYFDAACVEAEPGPGRVRVNVTGPFSKYVSAPNTAEVALESLLRSMGLRYDLRVTLWKGVPVSAGLGGSAASSVAALAAASEALDLGLGPAEVTRIAGAAEEAAAGSPHFDNAAASSFGGLVVVLGDDEEVSVRSFRLDLRLLVLRPLLKPVEQKTKLMRSVLPSSVPFRSHVRDLSRAVSLLASLLSGDLRSAGKVMSDETVTPYRAPLVPCFNEVRKALMAEGAYGVTISGAGPSLIALGPEEELERLAAAGLRAYGLCSLEAEAKVVGVAEGFEPLSPSEMSKLTSYSGP